MSSDKKLLHLALPKGRMQGGVFDLLKEANIRVGVGQRAYRASISLPNVETKILKPQNIVEMLHVGSRDIGFAGADWVAELNANLVELVDTELDPVRIVAAAPAAIVENGKLPNKPLVIASEYPQITKSWIEKMGLDATFVRTYGATEVFPPEDADCIVDNTATGSTLVANQLEIVDTLMHSSTRLYANPKALEDADKKAAIDDIVLVVRSVIEARKRVMVEVNVSAECLDAVVEAIPGMKRPTVSKLIGDDGFAVKSAVTKKELPLIVPKVKAAGGTDLVVTSISQIVP